ncbi:MAG: hypothetical protein Q7R92_03930 [bacterium]|nr:hypothetical protein [bacterium]
MLKKYPLSLISRIFSGQKNLQRKLVYESKFGPAFSLEQGFYKRV